MKTFEIRYCSVRLTVPYQLSFGAIDSFDSYFVKVETPHSEGFGEITPLPGYSSETREIIETALQEMERKAAASSSFVDAIDSISAAAPMTVSGLCTALDVADLGCETVFGSSGGEAIPVAALCSGVTPEDAVVQANQLVADGAKTLKLKVASGTVEQDIARIQAVSHEVEGKAVLRLDANQRLDPNHADRFVDALAGLPIALLEQPFLPENIVATAALIKRSSVPIMLDESIWDIGDLEEAGRLHAPIVKLKLCKHQGVSGCRAMLRKARQLGLGIVFGNGVQTAVGNRIEMFIYRAEGLSTAVEATGFVKPGANPGQTGLALENWTMREVARTDPAAYFNAGHPITSFCFDN